MDRAILHLPDYSPQLKAPYDPSITLSGGPPNMIDVIRITKNTEISLNARKIKSVQPPAKTGSDEDDEIEPEDGDTGVNAVTEEEFLKESILPV